MHGAEAHRHAVLLGASMRQRRLSRHQGRWDLLQDQAADLVVQPHLRALYPLISASGLGVDPRPDSPGGAGIAARSSLTCSWVIPMPKTASTGSGKGPSARTSSPLDRIPPNGPVPNAARIAVPPAGSASHSASVEDAVSGRAGGLPATTMVSASRMSRDDAPTAIRNSPGSSTHRRWAADQ